MKADGQRGASSLVHFDDPGVGLSGQHPHDWHRERAVGNLVLPREVLSLASYSLRGGNKGGGCAPEKVLADMPPDGAFVWLQEYRPLQGEVWADLSRSSFPPKPVDFELRRTDLKPGLYCHRGPAYSTTFRAADRAFQLFLAFGDRAADERLAQVEAVLDSLRFENLPPPSPDPYAGWPLVSDNSGDSLRPPPGWPGAAFEYQPGMTSRPRMLFWASNLPLSGLPDKLVARMPEPDTVDDAEDNLFPIGALANDFPPQGVVLFVLEEPKGAPPSEFPPIGLGWPARDDFEPSGYATEPVPELKWLSAGGSFSGYRFSVYIGRGPRASARDFELALKSAGSLALSGCWRDRYDDCPDR